MAEMWWQLLIGSLGTWLEAASVRWQVFQAKLPRISIRWVLLLSVAVLAAVAFLVRCLHLFDSNHYYIISPDSYFFHWLAGRVMAGQGPPADAVYSANYYLHSGLAYPLAYISGAVRWVSGMSSADALALVAKVLPPLIGVITMVLIYLFAAKTCNRRVGLLSALAWVAMILAITLGSAGFLDRDGLSTLLFTAGAFLFYLSGVWHIRLRGVDVGWLVSGAGVLVTEALLYLEWSFAGVLLLLAVIAAYCILRFVLGYLERMEWEPDVGRRLTGSLGEVNWRPLALIVVANILVAGLNFHEAPYWYREAVGMIIQRGTTKGGGTIGTVEALGLTPGDLIGYQIFWIPMVAALYLAFKKRAKTNIFFSSWFLCLLVMAIFARRIMLFAAPAACLLSGVGLAFLWDWAKQGLFHGFKRVGMAVLLGLALVVSFASAAELATPAGISPDRQWQDALAYLRDETPKGSVVMSQWSWGYWILDLGQRRPVIDNGYYGYTPESLRDVALAYYTTDPAEAAHIMRKYGADYLVFSRLDLDIAVGIMSWANVGKELGNFPSNSLVVRSINGEFESGGGLEVVYRSPPEPNAAPSSEAEVVILALTQA
jgi:asparagine N-glycosylation enzyme membrane subunit Stt3